MFAAPSSRVADAQSNLGLMYNEGRGVLQDYKMAVCSGWRAAEQGMLVPNSIWDGCMPKGEACRRMTRWRCSGSARRRAGEANAQNTLGGMGVYGKGVPQDDKMAVAARRRARRSQCPKHLGGMYAYGKGVPQDNKMACSGIGAPPSRACQCPIQSGVMYDNGKVPQNDVQAYVAEHLLFLEK
ncbi:MAG: tetratricopeptide repeat protein [Candidatus Eutrophobiaceae bacterium]